jgi:hypothetical protein
VRHLQASFPSRASAVDLIPHTHLPHFEDIQSSDCAIWTSGTAWSLADPPRAIKSGPLARFAHCMWSGIRVWLYAKDASKAGEGSY